MEQGNIYEYSDYNKKDPASRRSVIMDIEQQWKSKDPKQHSILNVRAEVTKHRNWIQKASDKTGYFLVNPIIVITLILVQLLWCFFNLRFFQ